MLSTIKATSWVSSPMGLNLLNSIFKKNLPPVDKYIQMNESLKATKENELLTKIFVSSLPHTDNSLNKIDEIEEITFENGLAEDCINKWVKQKVDGLYLENTIPTNIKNVIANIHTFKDIWSNWATSTSMKVYNSFNYTQDIKYEARLIELPTKGDFKLAILIPNEEDVLDKVFAQLAAEGLEAAVNCLQPVFTTITWLNTPSIRFDSNLVTELGDDSGVCLQRGKVQIDDRGVNISVLTCLYEKDEDINVPNSQHIKKGNGFYFALVFKDKPLFTGRYLSPEKNC